LAHQPSLALRARLRLAGRALNHRRRLPAGVVARSATRRRAPPPRTGSSSTTKAAGRNCTSGASKPRQNPLHQRADGFASRHSQHVRVRPRFWILQQRGSAPVRVDHQEPHRARRVLRGRHVRRRPASASTQ
jgi:hypothetical protein